LLYDPQTAGGLLASVASEDADATMAALREANIPASLIGEVREPQRPLIEVLA